MTTESQLGRIGQASLDKWAAQVGITANPSFNDERGWDAFLQVASADSDGQGPLDRAPPQISCMVQIKTTRGDDQSEPIKLSNWRPMCTDPIPWFVLAVHVDGNDEPCRAYLVHIDETWCARALKKLRALDPAERNRLNKHTMSVSWSEAERLPDLHGRELLRLLRAHVKKGQHAYVEEKVRWVNELGYDDTAKRITMSVRATDLTTYWEELADLGVGLRSAVPGDWRARVWDVRFGIPGTLSEFARESGDMHIRVPGTPVQMEVVSANDVVPLSDCQMYRAQSVFPFLPSDFDKFRVTSAHVTCTVKVNMQATPPVAIATFGFELPSDEAVALGEVDKLVRVLRMIFEDQEDPITIRMTSARGSGEFQPGRLQQPDSSAHEFFKTLELAVGICHAFGVDDTTSLIVSELRAQRQAMGFIAMVLNGGTERLEAGYDEPVPVGDLFAVTTEWALQLPDRRLAVFVGVVGMVTTSDEVKDGVWRIVVDTGAAIVEKLTITDEGMSDSTLDACRVKVLAQLREMGCRSIFDHVARQRQLAESDRETADEPSATETSGKETS